VFLSASPGPLGWPWEAAFVISGRSRVALNLGRGFGCEVRAASQSRLWRNGSYGSVAGWLMVILPPGGDGRYRIQDDRPPLGAGGD